MRYGINHNFEKLCGDRIAGAHRYLGLGLDIDSPLIDLFRARDRADLLAKIYGSGLPPAFHFAVASRCGRVGSRQRAAPTVAGRQAMPTAG